MDQAQALPIIQSVVIEALELDDDEEVSPQTLIIDDLGADSLDFVDILFRLEKTFDVKIREGESDLLEQLDLSNPEVVEGDFFTPKALDALRAWLPELSNVDDPACVTPAAVFSMISVMTLWRVVEQAQATKERGT